MCSVGFLMCLRAVPRLLRIAPRMIDVSIAMCSREYSSRETLLESPATKRITCNNCPCCPKYNASAPLLLTQLSAAPPTSAAPHVGEPLNTTCNSFTASCSSLVRIGRVAQSGGSSPFGFATIRLKCAWSLTSSVVRTGFGQASEMVRTTPRTPAAILIVSKRVWSSSNVTSALAEPSSGGV